MGILLKLFSSLLMSVLFISSSFVPIWYVFYGGPNLRSSLFFYFSAIVISTNCFSFSYRFRSHLFFLCPITIWCLSFSICASFCCLISILRCRHLSALCLFYSRFFSFISGVMSLGYGSYISFSAELLFFCIFDSTRMYGVNAYAFISSACY